MTPERMAGLVARWVRLYTRDLTPSAAERRIDEVDADLHDHIVHERAAGTEDRRIVRSIAARMVRGMAADASWRHQIARSSTTKEAMTRRSTVRVALVTVLVLLVPAVAMLVGDGTDWGVFDFVFAGVLVAGSGLLLEAAARRPPGVLIRGAAVAVGVAAIVFGESDDAPGAVLFGLLLIGATVALTVRTLQRSR